MDTISRAAAIDEITEYGSGDAIYMSVVELKRRIEQLPSAQPERLTDDDFETIRIHLNAYKEKLCNQQRWEEAEEYQRIIDRFMAFATTQQWIPCSERLPRRKDHTDDMVLVCYGNGLVRFNTCMNGEWCQGNPIAWMPLPEPCTERREK